jgi:hypothetical protein
MLTIRLSRSPAAGQVVWIKNFPIREKHEPVVALEQSVQSLPDYPSVGLESARRYAESVRLRGHGNPVAVDLRESWLSPNRNDIF